MVIVIMGVSGSGKTTIGRLLASRLRCGYSDADVFHPEANIEKMARGVALDDGDRAPWLRAMRAAIEAALASGRTHVFSCSALRERYRAVLAKPWEDIVFVHLDVSYHTVMRRLASRQGHFFDPRLACSQFQVLEVPRNAIVADAERTPEEIVDEIVDALARRPLPGTNQLR
ncbi:MAG: gluconokinase [Pigmentiphaga sp.]|uniref:gluconokinase n=1 Tax=Pigmentiphaga sp. TaxID=1977564 RepID=UPI0029AEDA59|nr:gluconokinase [Pigmentiphaga sp.]MDX3906631.1 gluconokinase [Pigmentiphaga sp.]